ncbi:DUF397 domain-containing protein [Salinactinospora qingdaonensis]|uniref:DUF397 domain-containing protein n=1 Tax=Salinactinospora qingdaonensis TaxID=702744 RepID=A0ABP7G6E8_9ACTN
MIRYAWHKSRYSGASGDCVEVSEGPEKVKVRDSQHRERGHLSFGSAEWRVFLDALKDGGL